MIWSWFDDFSRFKIIFWFFFVHVTTWVTPFVNNKVKGLKCFCPILCPCLPSVSDPTNLGLLVSCRQPHQRLISPLTLTVFLRLLIVLKKWNQKMFYIMRFKDALINYFKHCCPSCPPSRCDYLLLLYQHKLCNMSACVCVKQWPLRVGLW